MTLSWFLERLEEAIATRKLIKPGDNVLVGVSGGPDSTALLFALKRLEKALGHQVFAVHVNHHLRGEESDEDEKYVVCRAKEWNIPVRVMHVDVTGERKKHGGNKQAVSRTLRYRAFKQAAEEFKADRLALAHHADDQLETVLMRLLRGTGVSGLAGMDWARPWEDYVLIRPLLGFRKEEIVSYCREQNLSPREDSSNRSLEYTRNRIRHELIPVVRKLYPHADRAVSKLSDLIREEERDWDIRVKKALEDVVADRGENCYTLDVSSFLHLSVALQRRVVKLILSYLCHQDVTELSLDKVDQVRKLAENNNPSAMIRMFQGIVAEREYSKLIFTKKPQTPDEARDGRETPEMIRLPGHGASSLPGFLGRMEILESDQPIPIHRLKNVFSHAVFDLDLLSGPLYVRARKPGDKMRCSGMRGRKKVKSLMMEAKIPKKMRSRYPLVGSGDEIIWIPGVRRSDLAPVTASTKRFLYLLWDQNDTPEER